MQTKTYNIYEYRELPPEAQEKAIQWFIDSEIELMNENSPFWPAAVKAEEMRTPWFIGSYMYDMFKSDIIDNIIINNYTFLLDGTRHD